MPDQLQLRGGTTTEHATFTGASKEVTIDTTKKTAVVHDASTAGGNPLMREDGANSALINGSVTEPALAFADDSANTGIYSPGTDQVAVTTDGVERVEWGTTEVVFNDGGEDYDFRVEGDTNANLLFVDASTDRIGVGTDSPGSLLHLSTDAAHEITLERTGGSASISKIKNAGNLLVFEQNTNGISFETGTSPSESARIDSSGRLLVGTSTSTPVGAAVPAIIQTRFSSTNLAISALRENGGAILSLGRVNGSANEIVSDGDSVGQISFAGADGTDVTRQTAQIYSQVDGTPAENVMPGRLIFATTSSTASANPTERMTIDSSGRVGIGMTPSADDSITDVSAGLIQTDGNIDIRFPGSNNDPSGARYLSFINNDTTIVANQPMGGIRWTGIDATNPNSDTASILAYCDGNAGTHSHITFNNGGSESARIDSSGRLLVGTTSNIGSSTDNRDSLNLVSAAGGGIMFGRNDSATVGSNNIGRLRFYGNTSDGTYEEVAAIRCSADDTHTSTSKPTRFTVDLCPSGSDSVTERIRLEEDGQFNLHTDTTCVIRSVRTGASESAFVVQSASTSTLTGTTEFIVYADGDVQNTNNRYEQISDEKFKENIVDANSQWDDIKAVRVRNFNFKEETGKSTHTQLGVVAQEIELTSPGLVKERKDPDTDETHKSVAYSVLYMKAVKALQEAMERIETLEAKVAALEAN